MPKGPGLSLTFLYYGSTTILVVAIIATQQLGWGWFDTKTAQLALFIGIIMGGLGTFFNRSRTMVFSYPKKSQNKAKNKAQKKADQSWFESQLADLGFTQKEKIEEGNYWIYEKPGWKRIFAGKILVQFNKKDITVGGRSMELEVLQEKISRLP